MKHLLIRLIFLYTFLVSFNFVFSQDLEGNKYSESNGFCSTSLYFGSENVYFFETGCEHISSILIGSWKRRGNNVILNSFDSLDNFEVFTKIKKENTQSDTTKIFITDINGEDLLRTVELDIYLTEQDSMLHYSEMAFVMEKYSDESAYKWENIIIKKDHIGIIGSKVKSVTFKRLSTIFDKKVNVKIDDNSEIFVQIGLPRFMLDFREIEYFEYPQRNKKLEFKDDGLYSKGKLFLSKKE